MINGRTFDKRIQYRGHKDRHSCLGSLCYHLFAKERHKRQKGRRARRLGQAVNTGRNRNRQANELGLGDQACADSDGPAVDKGEIEIAAA